MELGPLQKQWVKLLRDNSDKQGKYNLGTKSINDKGKEVETFCCLGMAAKMLLGNSPIKWIDSRTENTLVASFPGVEENQSFLKGSFHLLGLKDKYGSILDDDKEGFVLDKRFYESLLEMNDSDVPWSKIADFIEAHPELVFDKSV